MIFEDPDIIEMKLAHLRALLKNPEISGKKRAEIVRMVAEASGELELSKEWDKLQHH